MFGSAFVGHTFLLVLRFCWTRVLQLDGDHGDDDADDADDHDDYAHVDHMLMMMVVMSIMMATMTMMMVLMLIYGPMCVQCDSNVCPM